jgi:hypothetical protein
MASGSGGWLKGSRGGRARPAKRGDFGAFPRALEFSRRQLEGFFDFGHFSALQGFADRDRTTAERDPKAKNRADNHNDCDGAREREIRASMSTVKVVGTSGSRIGKNGAGDVRGRKPGATRIGFS